MRVKGVESVDKQSSEALPEVPVPREPYSTVFSVGQDRFVASGFAQVRNQAFPKNELTSREPFRLASRGPPCLSTVIYMNDRDFVSRAFLQETIQNFKSQNDVFRVKFLRATIFYTNSSDCPEDWISPKATALLRSYGNEWIDIIRGTTQDNYLLPGCSSRLEVSLKCSSFMKMCKEHS